MYKLFAVALTVALSSTCSTLQTGDNKVGLPNFKTVEPGFYRGGQPDAKGVAFLKSIGVKTIISLNDRAEPANEEARAADANDIEWIWLPMSGVLRPDGDRVDLILDLLRNPDNWPVYIHCQHGQDRTGLLVGLYRVEQESWTAKNAYDEMKTAGFHPELLPLWEYYWERTKGK